MEKKYYRNVAKKINIARIIAGEYVQEEDENPNYLLSLGEKIYRLNLMAVVLEKSKQGAIINFFLDDGSGQIYLRFFEENNVTATLNIGDVILVIGKVRSYNQEKYLSAEIVKKISPLWLNVRKLETKKVVDIDVNVGVDVKPEEVVEEKKENTEIEILPVKKIITLIKDLDRGEGVMVEEIISKSPLNETEKIIEKMLETGEIFQNSPGKVKVL